MISDNMVQNKKPSFLPPANEVWGKVIFSEACVKNSVHKGRSASVHVWIPPLPPPGISHPPGAGTPWDQAPPPSQEQAPPGAGTLLDQAPPGPGTPSRACWEIRSTSGRYASYWNAFQSNLVKLQRQFFHSKFQVFENTLCAICSLLDIFIGGSCRVILEAVLVFTLKCWEVAETYEWYLIISRM